MPNVSITLPEVSQSVSRPVIFSVIEQVAQITKMDERSRVFFPGDSEVMHTPGSTVDSKTDRYALFRTNYITQVEVEEDYDTDTLNSTAVTGREHLPVFLDPALGITIKPVYSTTKVTINFKYSCPSKTEALRWRDDIRMRVSMMRDINLHDLTYQYLIPLEYLMLLKAIYSNRELVAGYGETFEEYVTSNTSDRLTVIGDLAGQSARLSISETQTRVIGYYDFDGVPEKPEQDDGVWVIGFSYKFSYEKPLACNMRYPVIVHNTLLPPEYTECTDQSYDLDRVSKSYTASLFALNGFETDSIMQDRTPIGVIRIPTMDDFIIPYVEPGTVTNIMALCSVDPIDKVSLLNLDQLGEIAIDRDILEFIIGSETPYITKLFSSMFHLSLYINNSITNRISLNCSSTLDVTASEPLDLRNQHRVKLSIMADITMLTPEALNRLKRYPKAFVKILAGINDQLRGNSSFINLHGVNRISANDFSTVYAAMTGQSYANGSGIPGALNFSSLQSVNNMFRSGVGGSSLDLAEVRAMSDYRISRLDAMVTGVVVMREDMENYKF